MDDSPFENRFLKAAPNLTIMVTPDTPLFSYVDYTVMSTGLVGFHIDLISAVCAAAGIACAVMTAPWQSAWPANYAQFGVVNDSNYREYGYPGEGFQAKWYDCAAGVDASVLAQQSLLFTHTYTNGPIRGNATGAAGAAFACRSDNPQAVRLLNKVTPPAGRARRAGGAHVCIRCTLSSLGRVLQGLEQLNRTNAFDNLCKGARALSRFIPFLSCA
jgi:hypothetical protein